MTQKKKVSAKTKTLKKGGMPMKLSSKKGFGINEIIGVAAGVIIAAMIVVPGLKAFATTIMTELTVWYEGVSFSIFQ